MPFPVRCLLGTLGAMLATAALAAQPAAPAAPAAPEPINACALLNAEEVADVTELDITSGRRHDEGVTHDGAYSSTCLWAAPLAEGQEHDPRAPLGGRSFAILNVMAWPGSEQAKKYLEDFRDAAEIEVISRKPVELKVGDEALWWGSGVAVRKAAVSFGISVHLTEGDRSAHRAMEEALAKEIAARL